MIKNQIIDLLNINVYGTNLLLLPALVYTIMIIKDINKWNNETTRFSYYLMVWWFLLILLSSTIFFSTLWHVFMFQSDLKFGLIKKISSIDYKYIAPLFTFLIFVLNLLYVYFLSYNEESVDSPQKTNILYYLSLFFQIIGLITFISKNFYFYPNYNRKDFLKKIKWAYSHTFFHYISYTGVSLFLAVLYLNNKNLYNFFENKTS